MERLAPASLKVSFDYRLPCHSHCVICAQTRLIQQRLHQLVRALSTVKRIDQRLHDRNRSAVDHRIRPRFKIVRLRHMPIRHLAGLVQPRSQVNLVLRLFECSREFEISGSGVDRIAAQNHQPTHFAGIQIRNQRLEVCDLVARHLCN